MYRTATAGLMDVMDQVMINVTVTEYPDMPGTKPPTQTTYCTTVPSVGADDQKEWVRRALAAMLEDL